MPVAPRRLRVLGFALALLVLAAVVGTAGCARRNRTRDQRFPVIVARVQVRDMPYEILANGTVEARQTAGINAQVGGVLVNVAFREGDEVRAGQVMFEVDPKPLRAALAQARAMLARDRAQYEDARLQAERSEQLVAQNYVSAEEAGQKRAAAQSLLATVHADSEAAVNAALSLSYATVRAPFGGRTGNLHVHVGDLIKANDTGNPMVTLNQIRPILVRFTVPERELPAVLARRSAGLKVLVCPSDSDLVLATGSLVFVDNAVDPATGTILMKGEFPNADGRLWPGEFVDTRLVVYVERRACVVPTVAVTTLPSGAYVYVLRPDTTVATQPVTVERTSRNVAVITSGLTGRETVVTDGQLRLSPGAKVQPKDGSRLGLEAGL
ncbi:MAG TPA: efflux RND transporter periplasmic adaptor subunit [Candidatus Saccharimonadales bacterium]|nr:efflux RND transporter periplasmic adaptor subunit [Candidatus Saccharimonadales bacterium]